MWDLLQDSWKSVHGLTKLVEKMPRACKAAVKANGGYFEESKINNSFDLFNTFFGSHRNWIVYLIVFRVTCALLL